MKKGVIVEGIDGDRGERSEEWIRLLRKESESE
jgi:hypothetical protein